MPENAPNGTEKTENVLRKIICRRKGVASLLDASLLNVSLEINFSKVKIPAMNLNDR
jgi:hypothetical protein